MIKVKRNRSIARRQDTPTREVWPDLVVEETNLTKNIFPRTSRKRWPPPPAWMDGTQLLSRPILKRYDLSPGTMQKALQALEAQAILRRDYQGIEVRYRFEDPFFKAWIVASTVSSHP